MKKCLGLCLVMSMLFVAGCKLNKGAIVGDFCSSYPEVCQYVELG